MPQCVKCKEFYPPDYTEAIDPKNEDRQICSFCKLEKEEVTVEILDETYKVTRQQCIDEYKALLAKFKEKYKKNKKRAIKDLING